jgi:hypothetical protein
VSGADEYHFVLACPLYSDLRSKFIKPYYYKKPSVFKLIHLFIAENLKAMYNLGKYLSLATIKKLCIVMFVMCCLYYLSLVLFKSVILMSVKLKDIKNLNLNLIATSRGNLPTLPLHDTGGCECPDAKQHFINLL